MDTDNVGAVSVDLSDAIPKDTGVLHIVVPGTNKRIGWQITFAGPGHPKAIAQNEELARASLDKAERIEMAQVNGRKWKGEGKQVADQRRENVDWVLGRILFWRTVVRQGTPPVDVEVPGPVIRQFSSEPVLLPEGATKEQLARAHDLLAQPYVTPFFIQMTDYLADQSSFIEASAKT